MSIAVTIAGSTVSIIADSIQITDRENQGSSAQFTVRDDAGTGTFSQNMAVTITDSVLGLQFSGYIDSAEPRVINPNVNKLWNIVCKDKVYLAQKRQVLQADYTGTLAGDVVTDLHAKYLNAEGVTANYATDHDHDATTFGAGTLTNTTAANGDLELSSAGTTVTHTEHVTSDFSSGTLTGVTAANNALAPTSVPAIKITGDMSLAGATTPYSYWKFWSGSYTINSSDFINYDIWIDPASPTGQIGIDLTFSDGTSWRDTGSNNDVQNQSQNPATDLTGLATGQWYHRNFFIGGGFSGKVVKYATIALAGTKNGTYTGYVRNIYFQHSATITYLFQNSLTMVPQPVRNNGYSGVAVSQVNVYPIGSTVSRLSPAISIDAAKIMKQTLITWNATEPAGTKVDVQYSLDGNLTYTSCTNGSAFPLFPAGTSIAGMSIYLKEIFTTDPSAQTIASPEVFPQLNSLSFSVSSAASATKTDGFAGYSNGAEWNTGTYSSTATNNSELTLNGAVRNFDDGSDANQSFFATNALQGCDNRRFILSVAAGTEARSRMDFAPQLAAGTLEVDILVDTASTNMGVCYRCTNWQNNDGSFAYAVEVTPTTIKLFKGNNSSSGTPPPVTQVGSTGTLAAASGNWHRLKVVFSGSNHQIFLDDILYINATDSTYTAAGYVGLRLSNASGSGYVGFFDNFGVTSALSGTWTSAAISLSTVGTYGTSVINWVEDSSDTTSCTVLVESSVNGGSTYQTVTNGGQIPNLTSGQNISAVSVLIRITLTTSNAASMPRVQFLNVRVIGYYSASGTRVSPSLSIGSVGRVGSSSITWTSNTPTSTTVAVEESLVASTGPWTTATSGSAIPTINSQPDPVSDGFAVNSSANYTSTNYASGVNATWTFDTTNSRLVATNGTNGLYVWNQVSATDLQIEGILNQADVAGIIWRYTNTSNFYFVIVADASASSNANTVRIFKRVAGVTSGALATGAISFTRGSYYNLRITMIGTAITVYFDGTSVATATDSGLSAAGSVGFLQSSTTATNWYSLRGQKFGDDVTGKSVWTRITLTTTDATVTPSVTDLITSVRGQQLMSGATLGGPPAYQYQGSVASALDDLAKKSTNYTWGITDAGVLTFQSHPGVPASWPLATVNKSMTIGGQLFGDILWSSEPQLKKVSPLYRNRQIIVGGIDTTSLITDTRTGDGFTQVWSMAYPLAQVPTVTLNGRNQAIGVLGVDTGKDFYYAVGDNRITQDTSESPPSASDTLVFSYYGQVQVVKQSDNTSQQTAIAALEGSSGIIEVLEKVDGLNAAASQVLADARVAQYSILSQDWKFTTLRPGLKSGQLLSVFVPEYGLNDVLMLITEVQQTIKQFATSGTLVYYDVTCTSGPNVGSWTKLFVDL